MIQKTTGFRRSKAPRKPQIGEWIRVSGGRVAHRVTIRTKGGLFIMKCGAHADRFRPPDTKAEKCRKCAEDIRRGR